jgi:hypothetical protein
MAGGYAGPRPPQEAEGTGLAPVEGRGETLPFGDALGADEPLALGAGEPLPLGATEIVGSGVGVV